MEIKETEYEKYGNRNTPQKRENGVQKKINSIDRQKMRKCKKHVYSEHCREEYQYIHVNNIAHDKKEINL